MKIKTLLALIGVIASMSAVAAKISGAPDDRLTIQWPRNEVDMPGANGRTYPMPTIKLPDVQNATYVARVLASGNEARTKVSALKVLKDDIRPTVVSLASLSGQTIAVCFNELMRADTVDQFNYSAVDGNNRPIGLDEDGRLLADGKTVVFRVTGLDGNTFKLTIKHAYDLAGNDINPAGQVTVSDGVVYYGPISTDIGYPAIAGEAYTCAPGKLSIYAGGTARANNGDQLHFACEEIEGDFDKIVKVTGRTAGRGGIMARDVLDPSSRLVQAEVEGDLVSLWARIVLLVDGTTPANYDRQSAISGVATTLPDQWIRLKRTGNSFHVFVRDSNHAWAQFASKLSLDMPETLCVGLYAAANAEGDTATFDFEGYGDYVPADDTIKPKLVSAGTLDKQTIGLKFSEQIKGASLDPAKFSVTTSPAQAVAVVSAKTGNQGDSVYLEVNGLTADRFTVEASGVTDLAGNEMVANSAAAGHYEGWKAVDLGIIQDVNHRPQVGDDPYVVGRSIILSSGDDIEIDYYGGGYNNFQGDLNHFVYKEVTGDFDIRVENTRFDKTDNLAGFGNGGLMVRASTFLPTVVGDARTENDTKVPRLTAMTYCLDSANGNQKALGTWRDAEGGGQGNGGGPGFGEPDASGYIGKWASYLNVEDSSGKPRANTSPQQNVWLRMVREGQKFTIYWSNLGNKWKLIDGDNGIRQMPNIPNTALIGWAIVTDANGGHGGQGPQTYVTANLRHFGTTPPELTVTQQLGAVQVSWNSARGAGFTLKMSNTVAGPWDDVTAVVRTDGANSFVTLAPSQAKQFFQMVK